MSTSLTPVPSSGKYLITSSHIVSVSDQKRWSLWKYFHIPYDSIQLFRISVCWCQEALIDQSVITFLKLNVFPVGVAKTGYTVIPIYINNQHGKFETSRSMLSELQDTSRTKFVQDPARMWKKNYIHISRRSEEGKGKACSQGNGNWKVLLQQILPQVQHLLNHPTFPIWIRD